MRAGIPQSEYILAWAQAWAFSCPEIAMTTKKKQKPTPKPAKKGKK